MKNMKSAWPAATLSLLAFSAMLGAETTKKDDCCEPVPPAPCYNTDDCCCNTYCLGPDLVNPAVRPKTCNGDFVITLAGFYWNAHQDGMEYAVESNVAFSGTGNRGELNNLIDADYKNPDFEWDFGFKVGLGYNSTHDGWDFGVTWTWYRGKASTHVEAEVDDNHVLLPLWSAMANPSANLGPLNATDIQTHWRLKLNLIDLELGREFWVSKYLTMRPHMGLRIAFIDQEWDIEHKGGSWSEFSTPMNNQVDMDNCYKGVGIRGGFDTVWNFGCGFALYGNLALSIIYGRFSVDHDEWNREAIADFTKTRILETKDSFRASRFATDLALGLQWSTMFCNCRYGFLIGAGWEHHMFLDQNQLWRVNRIGSTDFAGGENVFHQRRGDLDTQGWTLTVRFEF